MYPDGRELLTVWAVVSLIWLAGVTFLVIRNKSFLEKLFPKSGRTFKDKLDEVLKEVNSLESFKNGASKYVQKVALKRYNPYKDTGGDQSFSLSLLNGKNDGVVITSLHSRAGTRVFAKPVKGGREDQFEFSKEEQEVVNEAVGLRNL